MPGSREWTNDEITGLVRSYISKEFLYDRPDIELDDHFPLVAEGLIDSIRIFRLVGHLETTFAISVAPQDIARRNFETVDAIGALVRTGLARVDRA